MARFWFAPKRHGTGPTPVTWQGWTLTLGFCLLVSGLGMAVFEIGEKAGFSIGAQITVFFVSVAALTGTFLIVVYRRTDANWRWGDED